jgi:hypothetical protein
MSDLTVQERIESFKAGIVGAIALFLGFLFIVAGHFLWRYTPLASSGFVPVYGIGSEALVSGAIALFSGFLFGVTYRYIIRTDDNPHLKSGAVGAFGLIRGLSQADVGLMLHGNRWMLALLVGESLLMVAIAQVIVDWSLQKSWIRPFGTSPQRTSPYPLTPPEVTSPELHQDKSTSERLGRKLS